jgi:hypothetical protein
MLIDAIQTTWVAVLCSARVERLNPQREFAETARMEWSSTPIASYARDKLGPVGPRRN